MKTFLIILVISILVLIIGGVVYAKKTGYCSGPDGRTSWVVDRVSNKLVLSESQRANLVALKDKLISIRGEFKSSREEGRQRLINLLTSSELDQEEAQSLFNQYKDQASGHSSEVIEAIAVFTDSLNQEQRDQLIEWMNHKRGCRFGRHCG